MKLKSYEVRGQPSSNGP